MKRKIRIIGLVTLFLSGLSLLLYPFVANEWNSYRQSQLMTGYQSAVKQQEQAGGVDYEQERARARTYNEGLKELNVPTTFAVAEAREQADEEYLACLNLSGDGIMGIVEIPKISVRLPVYHTMDKELLEKAAGHLEGSSLPVGGEQTHAVISAHRGLPSAALFTDLDQLEKGDHFFLHVLDETLCYEVDQIHIVEPTETDDLSMEAGEDLVTLMTCTPYGINSHRLLVRGCRVPYEEHTMKEEAAHAAGKTLHTNYLFWIFAGLGTTGGVILLMILLDRRAERFREKQPDGDSQKAGGQ